MNDFWENIVDDAKEAGSTKKAAIKPLPMRDNETSDAFTIEFESHDGYPLFAYLHVPKSDGPHIPLFQAPGYGSVVAVPPYERRSRYVVLALCHRGQRHSDSQIQAAYPGLLTQGLASSERYIWRDIVGDCITAVHQLMRHDAADSSKLAVTGGDLAWLTAALTSEVQVLQSGGFVFADLRNRLAQSPDYPLREFNDFYRSFPSLWETSLQTLANFDPLTTASHVNAKSVLITSSESEREYATQLAAEVPGDATVRINTGRGHTDHVAIEEWLAEACGTTPGPAHYPRA